MDRPPGFRVITRSATALAAGALASGVMAALAAVPAGAANPVVHCPTDDLQSALNHDPAGSTITVSGTCTGTFTIARSLTLLGNHAILDGGRHGTVVTIEPGVRATLDNLLIQDGSGGEGGGIQSSGALTLNSSQVSNNTAAVDGGGVISLGGTVTINTSLVSHNSAALGGGGVANEVAAGTMTLNSSRVSNNAALIGGGVGNTSRVVLNSSQVSSNHATQDGGGVLNTLGKMFLSASRVSNNTATNHGGGIFNDNGGITTLEASQVFNDVATDGGGIFKQDGGAVDLLASLVFGNSPNNCRPVGSVPGCTG